MFDMIFSLLQQSPLDFKDCIQRLVICTESEVTSGWSSMLHKKIRDKILFFCFVLKFFMILKSYVG